MKLKLTLSIKSHLIAISFLHSCNDVNYNNLNKIVSSYIQKYLFHPKRFFKGYISQMHGSTIKSLSRRTNFTFWNIQFQKFGNATKAIPARSIKIDLSILNFIMNFNNVHHDSLKYRYTSTYLMFCRCLGERLLFKD